MVGITNAVGYRLASGAIHHAPADLPPTPHHILVVMAHIASDGTGILERWTVQRIADACHLGLTTTHRALTDLANRGLVLPLDDTAKIRRGHAQSYRIVRLQPHHRRPTPTPR
jgi:hypothetical protein